MKIQTRINRKKNFLQISLERYEIGRYDEDMFEHLKFYLEIVVENKIELFPGNIII